MVIFKISYSRGLFEGIHIMSNGGFCSSKIIIIEILRHHYPTKLDKIIQFHTTEPIYEMNL